MTGPVDIDPDIRKPVTDLAYKDDDGNWHAGPDLDGHQEGEFISESLAKNARKNRQRVNFVKSVMRNGNTEEEAREKVNEFIEAENDLQQSGGDPAEKRRRVRELRAELLGS